MLDLLLGRLNRVLDIVKAIAAGRCARDLRTGERPQSRRKESRGRRRAIAIRHLRNAAVGVGDAVACDEIVFEIGREIRHDAGAHRPIVDVGKITRPNGRAVDEIAVPRLPVDAEANPQAVHHGKIHHSLEAAHVIIAGRCFDIALELAGWLLGNEDDRASRGVAPLQRALRAFQNLNILEVEEGTRSRAIAQRRAADGARRHHIGEIDADGGRGRAILGKAANGERGIVRSEPAVARKRRRIGRQIASGDDVPVCDLLLVEDGDGNGNVLQTLFDTAGRNDDVGHVARLRQSLHRQDQTERRAERETVPLCELHCPLPPNPCDFAPPIETN